MWIILKSNIFAIGWTVTVDAISGNDFATLRAMVYIGALIFIAAQIATDIAYTLVDPRVRLS